MQEKEYSALSLLPVGERNEVFNALTRRQQAVEVAKDVLAQLNLGRYKATNCVYLDFHQDGDELLEISKSLQVVLDAPIACNVCAIGGVFASMVRLKNTVRTRTMVEDSNDVYMVKKLEGIFSESEMRAMEFVFEGASIGGDFGEKTNLAILDYRESLERAYYAATGVRIKHDTKHKMAEFSMRAIMQNVIDNDGAFVIPNAKIRTTKK